MVDRPLPSNRRAPWALVLSVGMTVGLAGCVTSTSISPPTASPVGSVGAPPPSVGSAASPTISAPSPSPQPSGAIDPADFVAVIDNPWFPLKPGTTFTYAGAKDGEAVVDVFAITAETKVVDGVTCVVIRDELSAGAAVIERTEDWYVQDRAGSVWYFGEATAELDDHGKVTSTEGSWTAGVNGAMPGIFMPADPQVGYSGEQEHYPGNAQDRYVVLLLDGSVKVPFGSFSPALLTAEWTVLEPTVLSEKFYARGVGEVKEFDVTGGHESLQLTKVSAP